MKHYQECGSELFCRFLRTLDTYLLNKELMLQFMHDHQLPMDKIRVQRDIKRFLNKVYHYEPNNSNSNSGGQEWPEINPNCTPRYLETFNWDTLLYLLNTRYKVRNGIGLDLD